MTNVFIEYNPYKLETRITVDGADLADNSQIRSLSGNGTRLQEWIEKLPELLVDECCSQSFHITFHGTMLDYEDVRETLEEAQRTGDLKELQLEHIPAKETGDKTKLIDQVFGRIFSDECPFPALAANAAVKNAYTQAKNDEFEVSVVATMSAGKSTLINAMLGVKLMPSKVDACTAIITHIKDVQEADGFSAEVFDKEGHRLEKHSTLSYETMVRLNDDPTVSTIRVQGDIPFVSADDVSLVLIDTPGPNNARNMEHRKTQTDYLKKSSKALVLYIMTGEFGTDDDNSTLRQVADTMRVGGKQSRDRFLFVINKMDNLGEDDSAEALIDKVRDYLESHGIENPNLFPAAALPALNIRLLENGAELDRRTQRATTNSIADLNEIDKLHFETYATLPPSVQREIDAALRKADYDWDNAGEDPLDNPHSALIHTGIPSIEAAIRQYVEKYARTAKVKALVDSFLKTLESYGYENELQREILENQEKSREILEQITSIRSKLAVGEDARKFQSSVNNAVQQVASKSKDAVVNVINRFQERIQKILTPIRQNDELSISEAEDEIERLNQMAKRLEPELVSDLSEVIEETLLSVGESLLEQYKQKLSSLIQDISVGENNELIIDPLRLVGGNFSAADISARSLSQSKRVEDGEEWVKNTDKKWYKPWTWFQESGYYRTKYKTVDYVKGSVLAQEFLTPIQSALFETGDAAEEHAMKESRKVADYFKKEFSRLDNVLKAKLDELESCATDRKQVEERIAEAKRRQAWLQQIQQQVESILEI